MVADRSDVHLDSGTAPDFKVTPMLLWSSLLRIVLSLSLVASGVAGASMPIHGQAYMAATNPHTQAAHQIAMEQPCHAHAGMEGMSQHGHGNNNAPDQQQKHPQPDCCKSGLCQCACLHALGMFAAPTVIVQHMHVISVASLQPDHAGPVLANLIRPPIG